MKFQQVQNTNTDQRSANTKHPTKSTPNYRLKSKLKKIKIKKITHQIRERKNHQIRERKTWVARCDPRNPGQICSWKA